MSDVGINPGAGGTSAGAPHTRFVYDGRLGELYWIFIKNILLMIVTFSIWRFWGKTRMRRYLWSHTSLSGDRFEYTGTGGELFIGFIIVMVIYVAASIGIQILAIFVEPDSPILISLQFGLLFILLYLTFVAQYAAQRYRLTRTLWRGIRGGMTGSAWKWGFKGMFFSVLSLMSLTLAWPWAQMRLIDDRLNNSYFGDAKASLQTSSRPIYRPFIVGSFSTLIGGAIIIATFMAIYSFIQYGSATTVFTGKFVYEGEEIQGGRYMWWPALLYASLLGYVAILILATITMSFYYVAIAREVAAKLSLGGLRFSTPLAPGALISRYFWNIVIIVFTLGLGLPIAIHRTMLFLTRNIDVIGEIDGSEITRADLPRPKFGEGLLEAFDPGIL